MAESSPETHYENAMCNRVENVMEKHAPGDQLVLVTFRFVTCPRAGLVPH